MLILPTCGAELMLNAFLVTDKILKLFKNDVTPDASFVASDFIEADFDGYTPQPLFGISWIIVQDSPTEASYSQQEFVSSNTQTPQDVYGYYVIESDTGTLCWAERFTNGPYNITNDGDDIKVTPVITQETKS